MDLSWITSPFTTMRKKSRTFNKNTLLSAAPLCPKTPKQRSLIGSSTERTERTAPCRAPRLTAIPPGEANDVHVAARGLHLGGVCQTDASHPIESLIYPKHKAHKAALSQLLRYPTLNHKGALERLIGTYWHIGTNYVDLFSQYPKKT